MITASCLICLEIFLNKEILSVLPCGHIYHQICLKKWFKTKKSCPSCRCAQGNKKYVERIYFDIVENPSSTNLENFNEAEAILNSKVTKLQMENRILTDKVNDINKSNNIEIKKLQSENKQLHQKIQVFHSLNNSISKTLETMRAEHLQIQIEKSIVENDLSVLKNETKKLNFINEMIKDETGEMSEKIKSIQMSTDINSQIEMISNALVIAHKNKVIVDESNAKLQKEINNYKKINQKLTLKLVKVEENLREIQNEEKCNKIQLAELEKHFKTPNLNISLPIRKESVPNISEIATENVDSSRNDCSGNENSFTDSSNDFSPNVSIINNTDNPFPIVSYKKKPIDLLNNLSIMRKSLINVTNQIANSTAKLYDSPVYNISSNKKLVHKQTTNSNNFRNLKRKIVDSQASITKFFKS